MSPKPTLISRRQKELLRIFREYGPINPYIALQYLRTITEIHVDQYFQVFHALKSQRLIIPLEETVFVPKTDTEKREWLFPSIKTYVYQANGVFHRGERREKKPPNRQALKSRPNGEPSS